MSRWISWVLKAGYKELDLDVIDGWIRVASLAHAASRRFSQHEGMDEQALEAFLRRTDPEGRCEISRNGFLRKVPRIHRDPCNSDNLLFS